MLKILKKSLIVKIANKMFVVYLTIHHEEITNQCVTRVSIFFHFHRQSLIKGEERESLSVMFMWWILWMKFIFAKKEPGTAILCFCSYCKCYICISIYNHIWQKMKWTNYSYLMYVKEIYSFSILPCYSWKLFDKVIL